MTPCDRVLAVPSTAGKRPAFPGLRPDRSGILVAPRGVIRLPAGPDAFDRLVKVLASLCEATPLSGHVRLVGPRGEEPALIFLVPPASSRANLSAFYDTAASAARLVAGRLYIGKGTAYVGYRDDRAPRGYDVPDFQPPVVQDELLFIDHEARHTESRAGLVQTSLARFCLRIAPVADRPGPPPPEVYALVPRALYGLVARYLRAHRLHYAVAALQTPRGEEVLLRIRPPSGEREERIVPFYVVDYLSRFPRVNLFVSALPDSGPSILVAWAHRYPLSPRHVAAALAPDEMVLLPVPPCPTLRLRPAPALVDGDMLTVAHLAQAPPAAGRASSSTAPPVQLSVRLRPDSGPAPPVAGLVLSPQEVRWLRPLLYRLPGDALASYSVCGGDEATVLLGVDRAVEGIPFGIPLRRLTGAPLLLPLRSRLVPDLPPELVRQALGLRDDTLTILTAEHRLDLPVVAFVPLSRAFVADPDHPRLAVRVRPPSVLPELNWKVPHIRPESDADDAAPRPLPDTSSTPVPRPEQHADFTSLLQERARAYEEAGDFLAAAVCYGLLNDNSNRARCYRRAAAALNTTPPPED